MSVPNIPSPDVSVDVKKVPTANDATAALLILTELLSIVILFLIEMKIVSEQGWIWIPLGVILFAMVVNPLVTLTGIREAITIILQGFNFTAFMLIIFPDATRNALVVTIVLLIAFFIFEFPRRFGLDIGAKRK